MKIQLDTTAKTIKVEERVNLGQLIESLQQMLPRDWKDFTIEANTVIQRWRDPIYIEKYIRPYEWWNSPWYCNGTTMTAEYKSSNSAELKSAHPELKSGIFNVEI